MVSSLLLSVFGVMMLTLMFGDVKGWMDVVECILLVVACLLYRSSRPWHNRVLANTILLDTRPL